jgi:hypothetical protein
MVRTIATESGASAGRKMLGWLTVQRSSSWTSYSARVERRRRGRLVLLEDLLGRGGRHERGLDLAGRPLGVRLTEESGGAGDVRARHRGALDRLEELAVDVLGEEARRGVAGEDLHARRRDVGLQDAEAETGTATRAERRDDVRLRAAELPLGERRRQVRVREREIDELQRVDTVEVHARDRVAVGRETLLVRDPRVVEEHESDRTALRDVEALADASAGSAARAPDDHAGECAVGRRAVAGRIADGGAEDERCRRLQAGGEARADELQLGAVLRLDGELAEIELLVGARRGRGDPPLAVVHGVGAGAVVAARRRDEDAVLVCVEERERGGVVVGGGAAADREVDDVDPVGDRLVHGGGGVGAEAPVDAAHAIRDHVGARCDPGDRAAWDAERLGDDRAVAGGRRRGVRPVPFAVACGREVVDRLLTAAARLVRRHEAVRADQLAVARERRAGIRAAAELALPHTGRSRVGLSRRIGIGE